MTSSENNNYGDVTFRVDDQKARTVGFEESTNKRSLGLWRGGRSIPEIKRLFGGKKLIARMTPYSENPFTATFNITGLEEAIEPLRKACHW
jgi:type VI secretion system protein VasI